MVTEASSYWMENIELAQWFLIVPDTNVAKRRVYH
jgi:hypothetical protein